MPDAFTFHPARVPTDAPGHLHSYIHDRTGSEAETESIVRSIGRYGRDASISYFEVDPVDSPRGLHASHPVAWTVRAVRLHAEPADARALVGGGRRW